MIDSRFQSTRKDNRNVIVGIGGETRQVPAMAKTRIPQRHAD